MPALYQSGGLYGYLTDDEETSIPAEYISATAFNEDGLALVSKDVEGNGWPYEHGYIDTQGNVVVPLLYQQLGEFSEGFALAQKNGKYGYVAMDGTVAVDFLYEEASSFVGGKAVVRLYGETTVIERPNWEASALGISEVDYVMLNSASECLDYLVSVFARGNGVDPNETDFVDLERFFGQLMKKMPALNAQIEDTKILILNENYNNVLSSSQSILQGFVDLFTLYQITPTETMKEYMYLMEMGIANVTYEGNPVSTKGDVTYTISPFPIPYFDPSIYKYYTTISEYGNYLRQKLQAMGSEKPNLSGAEGLVDYINYIYRNLEYHRISTNVNKVEIGTSKQQDFFQDAYELTKQINSILEEYSVVLQENTSNPLTVLVDGNNLEKTVKFTIYKDYLRSYIGILDGIRVMVGSQGQGIYLPSEELSYLFDVHGDLYFELDYKQNTTVTLRLFDSDKKTLLAELPTSIFLTMPAYSTTATVFATIPGQSTQNWGGLVKINNTIEFATTYAGEYDIRDAEVYIGDISELSVDVQEKIHFMVSKGFFELKDNNFEPEGTMSRTKLVAALVKMFFVQDTTATSNFSDVSPHSSDYALISAAYQAGIASGYEDNTFRGANITTKDEIVNFLASTLIERNSYSLTGDPFETIKVFSDYETIPTWAINNVALAVEHNIIDTNGIYNGTQEMTRKEMVTLLYSLYFKLYETPDIDIFLYSVEEGRGVPVFFIAVTLVLAVLILIVKKIKERIDIEKDFQERMSRVTTTLKKREKEVDKNEDVNLNIYGDDDDDDYDF